MNVSVLLRCAFSTSDTLTIEGFDVLHARSLEQAHVVVERVQALLARSSAT